MCQNDSLTLIFTGSPPFILPYTKNVNSGGETAPVSDTLVVCQKDTTIAIGCIGTYIFSIESFTDGSGCEGTNIGSFTVTVNENLTPTFGFDLELEYCLDATPVDLLTTSNNDISGSWNPSAISTTATGTTTYTFTPTAGQCVIESGVVAVEVTVFPTTVAGTILADFNTICEGETITLTLEGNIGNIVKWQRSTDNFEENIINIDNTEITLTQKLSEAGTFYYRAVVKSGVCNEEYSDTVIVTVNNE